MARHPVGVLGSASPVKWQGYEKESSKRETTEMTKFAIIDAVEKPKTQRTGLQLYPWQDLDVGKGFFVPDEKDKKPMRGNQLGQTGNQWAKRQNVAARFQSFRYTLDGSDGVFVQRVA